jgi:ASC-1-like (ASCH) protein
MEMQLDTIHFNNIKNKKKIYETRLLDEKRKKIKLLDVITFIDRGSSKTFKAKVTELAYFNDFESAIIDCGVKKVLPNVRSLADGIELYESIPGYKEGQKKYGILRMIFELC